MPTDLLDQLAADLKAAITETCAKVAEMHRIVRCESEFHNGYNQAVSDIAAKIRQLAHHEGKAS